MTKSTIVTVTNFIYIYQLPARITVPRSIFIYSAEDMVEAYVFIMLAVISIIITDPFSITEMTQQ